MKRPAGQHLLVAPAGDLHMKDVLVTMAGESYRVKAAQQCCHSCKHCRWGVVLTLVLATVALVAVAGLTVCVARQINDLRFKIGFLEGRIIAKHDLVEQLRAFENGMADATQPEDPDEEYEDIDNLEPAYPDHDESDTLRVENKVEHAISRRAIAPGRPRDPQLQLYHTLQTDSPTTAYDPARAAALLRGRQRAQYYAERPAQSYVTPPSNWLEQPTPVTTRRSRVMDGVLRSRYQQRVPVRSQGLQQQYVPQEVPQEVTQDDIQEVTQDAARSVESIDATVEVGQTWRPYSPVVEGPAIAAHFMADSSRHRGSHHFDGNGRLKHPHGDYGDWRASSWVQELGLDGHFRLTESGPSGGTVVVNTSGLYLVYAQVNYANEKDENGFWLYRNGQKELLCVNTAGVSGTGPSPGSPRANTCFTAGVLHLRSGDRVTLRDLAGERYRVLDHGGRSFLGLISLQRCKLKTEQPSRVTEGQ